MTEQHSTKQMVAVDSPYASNVSEVAHVLTKSGLHPQYDDRPLNAVRGRSFAKTTIYVPDPESGRARQILRDWYAKKEHRVERISQGMCGGLLPPMLIAAACGTVSSIATQQIGVGLIVTFLVFIPAVALWHKRH